VVSGPAVRTDIPDRYADAEVAFALTVTDDAAGTLIGGALMGVDRAPDLIAAMQEGAVDLPKLSMVASELVEVPDEQVGPIVARLLAEAARRTMPQLRRLLRRLVVAVDPAAAKARQERSIAKRCATLAEFVNGTASLAAVYLPAEKAAAAWNHVDAIAHATRAAGDRLGRDLDQIRADVFVGLLAGADPVAAGTAVAPAARKGAITVHLDLTTLAYLDEHPGSIDGLGPVLADVARQTAEQLADVAQWRFAVDHNGQTIAAGRLRYRPSAAQRRFVQTRDGTCRAPGCRRPAARCDLDHIRDWAHDGPTTVDNLILLCRRHHRAKHQGGYRLRRVAAGIEWLSPRGRRYTVLPGDANPALPEGMPRTNHLRR
jgi:Domain of unknown function (DUF222)/HNH endonuclease